MTSLITLHARRGARPVARAIPDARRDDERSPSLSASSSPPLSAVHRPANFNFRFAPAPIGGAWKRALDLTFASVATLLLCPIMLPVALFICLDSPGPALFRQRRTGFRGRSFNVLKLRTMRAEPDSGHQAERGDARVTRIGRFLRRTSIDELPQLLNVVAGDMSLVGPRPHAVDHDDMFWSVDADYARRFVARPGITGLAQVNGERGLSNTPEKVRRRVDFDLDYVDNWSMARDIAIIGSTIRVLAHDKNAY